MEKVFEKFSVPIGLVVWFIGSVVLPVAGWFYFIKFQIEDVQSAIFVIEQKEKQLEEGHKFFSDNISNKLDQIHKDIGEVKGELKRIK